MPSRPWLLYRPPYPPYPPDPPDPSNPYNLKAINSASVAIMSSRALSDHFAGPVGAVLVVKGSDGRFVVSSGSGSLGGAARGPSWLLNAHAGSEGATAASSSQDRRSKFRMLYAGTLEKVVMVERE